MSKEYLEVFQRLKKQNEYWKENGICKEYRYDEEIEIVGNALKRLEAIDNANPNEALECLEKLCDEFPILKKDYKIISQALLKAQEQEKENAYIEKIKTMMKQKDCVLRYIESEDCFAVKTILSDGWYKLTPAFVDDNIREEIKPLPLIEKIKQLKEENAELRLKAQEQEKENELLKEIIKSLFDRGCPLHQYNDSEGVLTIEVDNECSIMRLGEFKGVDLDKKLKEVLNNE